MTDSVDLLMAASLKGSPLDVFARRVAEAAFVGAARLDEVLALGGEAVGDSQAAAGEAGAGHSGELWLTAIGVEGFRGVAGALSLQLVPKPGLVLVGGRNGAGKSSIAEAAELALSGGSERSSTSLWSEGLVNLHHDGPTAVEVSVRVDAGSDVVVGRTLDTDRVDASRPKATRDGAEFDLALLGWDEAVVRFRPVLTYGELAALSSGKPSALYDPLNRILGLDALTSADAVLRAAETRLAQPGKDAAASRKAVVIALAASDDERAGPLREALDGKAPDLAAAGEVLDAPARSGAVVDGNAAGWAALTGPDPEAARAASGALAAALDLQDATTAGQAGRANRLANLLALAVQHRDGPDDVCPVCGQGRLDDEWLAQAREEMERQKALATEAAAAESGVAAAFRAARQLLTAVPAALRHPAVEGADPSAALAAWETWSGLAAATLDGRALAERLPVAAGAVSEEVSSLAAAAAAIVDAQERRWRPLADTARSAVRLAEEAAECAVGVAAVKAARAWLKDASEKIRNDRLKPFADQATEIWASLRQESNVSLSGVTLAGQNTRREVHLDLTVDGEPGPRAVLSQGELAALGLALFLPRSVAQESPFRFVLVDDPVQSFDHSKIDGLARVLHGLSQDRQIVVFTHDDRLLHMLKRLDLPFTAYRVARGERSAVTVEPVHDPVEQHLRDADALAKDTVLPPDLLALSVSGYCRDAIEEAANEVSRRRLTAAGATVAQAEEALEGASTTRARLGLALLGDHRAKPRPLDKALAALGADDDVVARCVEGVHVPPAADLPELLAKTRAFVAALRAAA